MSSNRGSSPELSNTPPYTPPVEEVDESVVYLDPSGDLTVHVALDEQQKTFIVSSKAMCLSSPVWRAMLDPRGHFKESSAGEVCFPEDDSESLLLILRIVHFQFQRIPNSLTWNQLLGITELCDKYDIVTLVRPWLPNWLEKWRHLADTAGYEANWVFIAWVYGDNATFERIIKRVAMKITTKTSGEYLDGAGNLLEWEMPPGIVGQ